MFRTTLSLLTAIAIAASTALLPSSAYCPGHGQTQPVLVARPGRPEPASPARCIESNPMGEAVRLCSGVRDTRSGCRDGRYRSRHDRLAGLVARRLSATTVRSSSAWHGTAPAPTARRRPRRRRGRPAAFRSAQQLARQRQPRQGAPPALADQAEIRPQDFVGRPDGADRQRRAGVHGVQDARFRRRSRRRLGSRIAFTGARKRPGSPTSATAATANSLVRSRPCRWD